MSYQDVIFEFELSGLISEVPEGTPTYETLLGNSNRNNFGLTSKSKSQLRVFLLTAIPFGRVNAYQEWNSKTVSFNNKHRTAFSMTVEQFRNMIRNYNEEVHESIDASDTLGKYAPSCVIRNLDNKYDIMTLLDIQYVTDQYIFMVFEDNFIEKNRKHFNILQTPRKVNMILSGLPYHVINSNGFFNTAAIFGNSEFQTQPIPSPLPVKPIKDSELTFNMSHEGDFTMDASRRTLSITVTDNCDFSAYQQWSLATSKELEKVSERGNMRSFRCGSFTEFYEGFRLYNENENVENKFTPTVVIYKGGNPSDIPYVGVMKDITIVNTNNSNGSMQGYNKFTKFLPEDNSGNTNTMFNITIDLKPMRGIPFYPDAQFTGTFYMNIDDVTSVGFQVVPADEIYAAPAVVPSQP